VPVLIAGAITTTIAFTIHVAFTHVISIELLVEQQYQVMAIGRVDEVKE
jgi:hypothetical protein